MNISQIDALEGLMNELKRKQNTYLLLHKSNSEQSECALQNLQKVELESKEINILSADVAKVRDIHDKYGIKSVPALLEFENGEFKNVLKGCLDQSYYKVYFENIIYNLDTQDDDTRPTKNVTVYTTPTCPWCTTVKNFLRKNRISYSEVDVAADQDAARSMVNKSGQQGVPQTEIDGEMVIGFDQSKLNRLLDI